MEKDYLVEIDGLQYIVIPFEDITPEMKNDIILDIEGNSMFLTDIESFSELVNITVDNLEIFYGSYFNKIIENNMIPFSQDDETSQMVFYSPNVLKDTAHRVIIPKQMKSVVESYKVTGIYYYDEDFSDIIEKVYPAETREVLCNVTYGKNKKQRTVKERRMVDFPETITKKRTCAVYVTFSDSLYPVRYHGETNFNVTGREIIDIKTGNRHNWGMLNIQVKEVKYSKSKYALTLTY